MLDAGPRDPAGELQAVLLYTVCVAASTAFVYFFLTSSGTEERLALAHLIWWYPFVFLILYYAFAAVAELGSGDLDTRWTGSTFESYVFFRLYVACQVVGCGVECLTSEGTKLLQMIAHHIISLLAYGVALTDGRCHFFGCAAGLSEVSTIFLQGILFSKHPAAKASWPEWFTILNGVLLWASYIPFRLVLFPAITVVYVVDARRSPERTLDRVQGVHKYAYPVIFMFLFCLSSFWFSSIHRGFVKKVLGGGAKAKGA